MRAAAVGGARFQHLDHLHLQLSVFIGENLVHMNLEETEHNAVLWACYSDEELHASHERIIAAIPPQEMQATMRWMIPAVNPAERAGMLLGMRAGGAAADRRMSPGQVRLRSTAVGAGRTAGNVRAPFSRSAPAQRVRTGAAPAAPGAPPGCR